MAYRWPADTDFSLWELDVLDRRFVRKIDGLRYRSAEKWLDRGHHPNVRDRSKKARAELAALEIELTQKLAARAAAAAPSAKKSAPAAATRTKEKDKIVRALRRLK